MRNNRFSLAILALFLVLAMGLGACSSGMSASPSQQQTQDSSTAEGGVVPGAPVEGEDDRMIVLTQTLRLKVVNTSEAVDAVRELAEQHSSSVTNMQMASDDGWVYDSPAGGGTALRGWLTVRVPPEDLDAFITAVSELGEVVYQAETADDVTQEHVDLSARLENLRAQEQRLRELVAEATTVEETLLVEQEMWRIRGEIESLDAQVQYLERQAAMATVTIELTEDGPVVENWGFMEALRDGFRAAAGVLAFTITFLIASSPLWLLGLAIFFIVRTIRRRRRAARGEDARATSTAQPSPGAPHAQPIRQPGPPAQQASPPVHPAPSGATAAPKPSSVDQPTRPADEVQPPATKDES